MTPDEFEMQLAHVAYVQSKAGWSEESVASYAQEQRDIWKGNYSGLLMIGAGLACDNTRHGVFK